MMNVGDIILTAYHSGIAIPAFNVPYLPMVEPVIRAVVDQDSFALIETARLEWYKFEAGGPDQVMAEFQKWQNPDNVRLHLDHVPVIDETKLVGIISIGDVVKSRLKEMHVENRYLKDYIIGKYPG